MAPERPPRSDSSQREAERFVVDYESPIIQYEHLHRYVLASRCVAGLRVLDLACGSGYGSAILRAAGARVVGADIELEAARRAEPSVCADALRLPFADAAFDAVVCFEAVEHVHEPAAVIAEIDRVLGAQGIAIISTPDRELYSDRVGNRNPFHIAEMSRSEFATHLAQRFPHVQLHGQSVWAGSWMARLDEAGNPAGGEIRKVAILPEPPGFHRPDIPRAPWVAADDPRLPTPLYLIALCARNKKRADALGRDVGADSILNDPEQWLTGGYLEQDRFFSEHIHELQAHAANLEASRKEREEVLAGIRSHAANLEGLLAEERARSAGATAHAGNLESDLRTGSGYISGLKDHVRNLEARLEERSARERGLEEHIQNLEAQLEERTSLSTDLEIHIRNLETNLEQATTHGEGLEAHIRNLEAAVEERASRATNLEAHARNLEAAVEERAAHEAGLETHTRNLETRIADLQQQIDGLASQLGNRDGQISDLRSQLEDCEGKLAMVRDESFDSRKELNLLRSSLWVRILRRAGLLR